MPQIANDFTFGKYDCKLYVEEKRLEELFELYQTMGKDDINARIEKGIRTGTIIPREINLYTLPAIIINLYGTRINHSMVDTEDFYIDDGRISMDPYGNIGSFGIQYELIGILKLKRKKHYTDDLLDVE